MRFNKKKFVYLISPNKIQKSFYNDLTEILKLNKVSFFQLRLKRFQSKSGDQKLFNILNDKQMNDTKKIKYCDYVVVNEKNLNILKKNLLAIITKL